MTTINDAMPFLKTEPDEILLYANGEVLELRPSSLDGARRLRDVLAIFAPEMDIQIRGVFTLT